MKTVEDQIAELRAELVKLTRASAAKDKILSQHERKIAELTRRISAQAGQITSLSTQISRLR